MSKTPTDLPPLTLRPLHAGDRAAIEHFFLAEMDDVSLYWRFFRTMTPMTVHAYVEQMRFDNGCFVLGAFFGERLVGVAELSAIPGSENCIENRPGALSCAELGIAVSNHLHQKGVGRQLLSSLLDTAWQRGLKRVQLSSLRDNRPMLGLAARLGFQPLREESGEIIMQALRPADLPKAVPLQTKAAKPKREINCTAKVVNARCR
ncbi:MAG: GNAT family N-acetyltransferase [Rhodocyclaceae bacterium]|nr:GNAT family N-acetyltransferase [Rhodocyclaceae bacterium]